MRIVIGESKKKQAKEKSLFEVIDAEFRRLDALNTELLAEAPIYPEPPGLPDRTRRPDDKRALEPDELSSPAAPGSVNRGSERESHNAEDMKHLMLDLLGLFPGPGELADLWNAILYIRKGKWLMATFSMISMLPGIGDLVGKGGKIARLLMRLRKNADKEDQLKQLDLGIEKVQKIVKKSTPHIKKLLSKVKSASDEKFAKYIPKLEAALEAFNAEVDKQETLEQLAQIASIKEPDTKVAQQVIDMAKTSPQGDEKGIDVYGIPPDEDEEPLEPSHVPRGMKKSKKRRLSENIRKKINIKVVPLHESQSFLKEEKENLYILQEERERIEEINKLIMSEKLDWKTIGHGLLDLVGLFPGAGEFADLLNAILYIRQGNYLMAAFSIISMIPVLGDVIGKGGKLAYLITKMGGNPKRIAKAIKSTQGLIKKHDGKITGIMKKLEGNEKIGPHVGSIQAALDSFTGEKNPQRGLQTLQQMSMVVEPDEGRAKEVMNQAKEGAKGADEEDKRYLEKGKAPTPRQQKKGAAIAATKAATKAALQKEAMNAQGAGSPDNVRAVDMVAVGDAGAMLQDTDALEDIQYIVQPKIMNLLSEYGAVNTGDALQVLEMIQHDLENQLVASDYIANDPAYRRYLEESDPVNEGAGAAAKAAWAALPASVKKMVIDYVAKKGPELADQGIEAAKSKWKNRKKRPPEAEPATQELQESEFRTSGPLRPKVPIKLRIVRRAKTPRQKP